VSCTTLDATPALEPGIRSAAIVLDAWGIAGDGGLTRHNALPTLCSMPTTRAGTTAITPSPRLILFDLDDTLCDYARARALRLRLAFSLDRENLVGGSSDRDLDGMISDSLAMHPHGADHFPELFRRHGIGDASVAAAAMAWYRANRFLGLELFADARATIAALRGTDDNDQLAGRRGIGVITNGPADVQRDKLRLLGVDALVDFVVISGEFGAWKPEPAIFVEALRLGNADPGEVVFVGDSPEYDVAGARAAGIRAIWINRTGQPWSGGDPPPDYEVANLTALLPLLGVATESGDGDRDG
jgi:putative hydrolase of the HAD superfamily